MSTAVCLAEGACSYCEGAALWHQLAVLLVRALVPDKPKPAPEVNKYMCYTIVQITRSQTYELVLQLNKIVDSKIIQKLLQKLIY